MPDSLFVQRVSEYLERAKGSAELKQDVIAVARQLEEDLPAGAEPYDPSLPDSVGQVMGNDRRQFLVLYWNWVRSGGYVHQPHDHLEDLPQTALLSKSEVTSKYGLHHHNAIKEKMEDLEDARQCRIDQCVAQISEYGGTPLDWVCFLAAKDEYYEVVNRHPQGPAGSDDEVVMF